MYDKFPFIAVGAEDECMLGWTTIAARIAADAQRINAQFVCIETYPGADSASILDHLSQSHVYGRVFHTLDLLKSPSDINEMLKQCLTDDPVFGQMNNVIMRDFIDPEKFASTQRELFSTDCLALIVGPGASLITPTKRLIVYADMARWELQMRQRRNLIGNLGADNLNERASLKYKRAFFVDWRAADRLKQDLLDEIDFLLDTNAVDTPKLITGDAFRRGLALAARRPFRVVPFFDPGPWGGHWMERVCNLPTEDKPNHAWCFDCVPEENSLLLGFGEQRVEIPAIDLVFQHPRELLGESIFTRFGAEFPIRFDFLDTMGGGNLSLQVHPLTPYIREHFGMNYTQDESYYMLDAEGDATVYLGLREGIDRDAMARDFESAQEGKIEFPATKYVNQFSARKHDHFLIPAGTIHCSGRNSMVLEISATPYIFTFKLWDWGRLGLDGRPRPVHLKHGLANIQWDRTTKFVESSLINHFQPVASGEGWREERTGLHELEFIETRRHWFTGKVEHNTQDTVHVLNLVEGTEAIVESPTGAFDPFLVHYAETFIVPAAVGAYTVRPHGPSVGMECATMLAFVRC
ncbi:MAG: class I mannose-6-phosphate isomerase [Acidobacteriota bacterium]|nr:class I mannose-6-phosphate isomerase [Acidobacteriota bacterium]